MPIGMDPKCSTNQSVVVLDPFHRSVYILSFVCFFFFYVCSRSLFIYLFIYIYYFVFLVYHFVSLSVYRGCWRMYVLPVIPQHTTSNGMALYYLLILSTPLLPVS